MTKEEMTKEELIKEEMTKEEAVKRLKEARSTIQPIQYVNEAIDYAIKLIEQESREDKIIDKHYWIGFNAGIRTEKFRESKRQKICKNVAYENMINRQAVLDEMNRVSVTAFETYNDYSNLYDFVAKLPSATPVEKIGQWVFNDTAEEHAHCSACGCGNVDLVNGKTHNYCEFCGAKMEMSENRMSRENAIRYCDEYLATNNVSNIDKEFLRTAKEALQQKPKIGHCEDCKHFCKLPYRTDTLGRCSHNPGSYYESDWYCADYEPQEEVKADE